MVVSSNFAVVFLFFLENHCFTLKNALSGNVQNLSRYAQTVTWHPQIQNNRPQNRGVVYFDFKMDPQCPTLMVERLKSRGT